MILSNDIYWATMTAITFCSSNQDDFVLKTVLNDRFVRKHEKMHNNS